MFQMFEKHTNGQIAFNTKPAIVTQRDIQGTSLDLL